MSDILIERMRAAIRKLDDRAIASRDYHTYNLEANDLRELLEQAIERITMTQQALNAVLTNHLLVTRS
jgi:hypothetical protein